MSEALGKIVEDEAKVRDAEADYERTQASAGSEQWSARPLMTEYCGLHESDNRYLIAAIKNAGGECRDFDETTVAAQSCDHCRHQSHAKGPRRDVDRERVYIKMISGNIAGEVKQDASESLLKDYRDGIVARQALEISTAYQVKGSMFDEPEYLPYCQHYSTPKAYAVCMFRNPNDSCPSWQDQSETGESPMTQSRSDNVLPATPTPKPETGDSGTDTGEATFLEHVLGMYTWLLDIPIDDELLQVLATASATRSDAENAELRRLIELQMTAKTLPEHTQTLVRESQQYVLIATLRTSITPAALALVAAYDAAHPPLVEGPRRLNHETASAFVNVVGMAHAVRASRAWAPMASAAKKLLTHELATNYGTLPGHEQSWLEKLPGEFAKTHPVWGTLGSAVLTVLTPEPTTSAAPAAHAVAATESNHTAELSAPASDNSALDDPGLNEILDNMKQTEDSVKDDPELALQVRLRDQVARASMISNMLSMRNEAQKAIISNMRA